MSATMMTYLRQQQQQLQAQGNAHGQAQRSAASEQRRRRVLRSRSGQHRSSQVSKGKACCSLPGMQRSGGACGWGPEAEKGVRGPALLSLPPLHSLATHQVSLPSYAAMFSACAGRVQGRARGAGRAGIVASSAAARVWAPIPPKHAGRGMLLSGARFAAGGSGGGARTEARVSTTPPPAMLASSAAAAQRLRLALGDGCRRQSAEA